MTALGLPSVTEGWRYMREQGAGRALAKFVASYLAGEQRWYLTFENLNQTAANHDAACTPFTFRPAHVVPAAALTPFTSHVPRWILRRWCGPEYFFWVTLHGPYAVAYRCLSRLVHPAVAGFVTLAPDQLFMVDEFTVPAFRRRGITRVMAAAMAPMLVATGFESVLGIHRTDNYDTIAATRAKGIRRLGTITRTRRFRRVSFGYEPAWRVIDRTPAARVRRLVRDLS